MDQKKSQQYNFIHESIPIMFHSQNSDFMLYLKRDGLKFLRFWWDAIGQRLPYEKLSDFKGMEYEFIEADALTQVVIITLPEPHEEGEGYYLGLISKPEKRFAWLKLPTTRVIALLRKEGEDYPHSTEIGDLTPSGKFVTQGRGPYPDIERFTEIVMKAARKEHV
jgi:hypothetical protein